MKTRCSGAVGEIDPLAGVTVNQETLLLVVKVKGAGPPAPTSIYLLEIGEKLSRVIDGGGQL
jgi:hypothetical protein